MHVMLSKGCIAWWQRHWAAFMIAWVQIWANHIYEFVYSVIYNVHAHCKPMVIGRVHLLKALKGGFFHPPHVFKVSLMHQLERKYVYCHPLCRVIMKQMSSIMVNMLHPSIVNKKDKHYNK